MAERAFAKPAEVEVKVEIPQMMLWRILVRPMAPRTKSDGGIALPDDSVEAQRYVTTVGKILSMGSLCYSGKTKSGLDLALEPNKPKVGDWVLYGKYAGQNIRMSNGETLVILDDVNVLSVVTDPTAYSAIV